MHMHFSPRVMLAINVEAGRLLGWLHDAEQAATELNATPEEKQIIAQVFNSSYRIAPSNIIKIESKPKVVTVKRTPKNTESWLLLTIVAGKDNDSAHTNAITCKQEQADNYELLREAGFLVWSSTARDLYLPGLYETNGKFQKLFKLFTVDEAIKFTKSDEYTVYRFSNLVGA